MRKSSNPAHRGAPVARAALLSELGRHAEALRDFDHLLAQSPGDPALLTNAGIVLERLGRMSDAIARCDAVLAANPNWTDALLNHSAALASLGRLDEALVDAERLCALRLDLPDGHYNPGEILLAIFRSQEALSARDAVLGLDPEHANANANLNLGLALSELRRFAEAQDPFDRAIALADLFLNAFIFIATTTACDALWMGLPVLTCPGRSTASRVAASLLTTLRMKHLVAGDMATYEAIACELAADWGRLGSLAGELAAKRNSTPFFDTAGKVRAIERAYLAMWQRFCSGQSAQSFAVSKPGWYRA